MWCLVRKWRASQVECQEKNPFEEDVCCNVLGEDLRGEHFIFRATHFVLGTRRCFYHRGFILKNDSKEEVKEKISAVSEHHYIQVQKKLTAHD